MDLLYDNTARFYGAPFAPREVTIWDETLRDGEQSPGIAFHAEEKVAIARALSEAGVGIIDAGMPIISEDEREAIRRVVDLNLPTEIGVTVRCHEADLRKALECGVRHVYMFLSVSRLHMRCKFGMDDPARLRETARRHVALAKELNLEVTFIAEDSTGAEPEELCELFRDLYDEGVRRAIICDTAVRVPAPTAFYNFCRFVIANSPPEMKFGVHCHNDFGCAAANTLLAVMAGATLPTVTVNGIGERAGNASLEQVVASLEKMGIRTGIRLESLFDLSRLIERCSGMPISMYAPVVGLNAFRHESGIHAAGVLEDPRTYETIMPEEVGRKREIIFGKHSGRHQLADLLKAHGIEHSPAMIDELLRKIKEMKSTQSHAPQARMVERLSAYYREYFGISEMRIVELAREMKDHDDMFASAA